jgi:hypothetical protein
MLSDDFLLLTSDSRDIYHGAVMSRESTLESKECYPWGDGTNHFGDGEFPGERRHHRVGGDALGSKVIFIPSPTSLLQQCLTPSYQI